MLTDLHSISTIAWMENMTKIMRANQKDDVTEIVPVSILKLDCFMIVLLPTVTY